MKYAAVIEYDSDTEKVQAARPAHREYLRGLLDAGKLAAAGPFNDGSGALIVYETANAEDAEALVKGDPFFTAGVFVRWQLRAWTPVMANRKLMPDG